MSNVAKKIQATCFWWVWEDLTWSSFMVDVTKENWVKKILLIDCWANQWSWVSNQSKSVDKLISKLNEYKNIYKENLSIWLFVTHAHLDHVWMIPKLLAKWIDVEIFCSEYTAKLMELTLFESLKIRETNIEIEERKINKEKVDIKNRLRIIWAVINKKRWNWVSKDIDANRNKIQKIDFNNSKYDEYTNISLSELYSIQQELRKKLNENIDIHYTEKDIYDVLARIKIVENWNEFQIEEWIYCLPMDNWHLLWSSSYQFRINSILWRPVNMFFSWDIWRFWPNISRLPTPVIPSDKQDLFVIESTYWWRLHWELKRDIDRMKQEILHSYRKHWKIIIPAFSKQRAQDIAYLLLQIQKELHLDFPIYFDWDSLRKSNDIFEEYSNKISNDRYSYLELFKNWNIWMVDIKDQENEFLRWDKMCVLIAPSWMLVWWVVMEYIKIRAPLQKTKVFLVWYQSPDSLWHKLLDEEIKEITIDWKTRQKKIKTIQFNWFSSHWDQEDIFKYLREVYIHNWWVVYFNHWTFDSIAANKSSVIKEKNWEDWNWWDQWLKFNLNEARWVRLIKWDVVKNVFILTKADTWYKK